jgi:uncharacterized protein YkuJ
MLRKESNLLFGFLTSSPIIERGRCIMNQQDVKTILLNLQNKQYIESDITHTFSENNSAVFSVKYLKNDQSFEVIQIETNSLKRFDDVDSAVHCINNLIAK